MNVYLALVRCTCMNEGFKDGLISVLKLHVFADKCNIHLMLRVIQPVEESLEIGKVRLRKVIDMEMAQYHFIKTLAFHVQRNLIDGRSIDGLDHMARLHVTEQCHFSPDFRSKFLFCTAYDDVRMHTGLLKHLYGVLCRLGLQLLGSTEIRNECQMDAGEVFLRKFPLKLTDRLQERLRLHVTYSSTHLGDDDIEFAGLAEQKHTPLDFISDMRDDLYGLSEISAFTLLIDNGIINFTGSNVVRLGHVNAKEALVMSQVQVGLGSVIRHVALAMLVRVQCSRVNVDVRIEFLNGDSQPSGLQKFS